MPPGRLNNYYNNGQFGPIPITAGRSIKEEKAFYEAMYRTRFPTDDKPHTTGYKKLRLCTDRDVFAYADVFKESKDFDQDWSDCPYDNDFRFRLKQRISEIVLKEDKLDIEMKKEEREEEEELPVMNLSENQFENELPGLLNIPKEEEEEELPVMNLSENQLDEDELPLTTDLMKEEDEFFPLK